MLSHQVVGGRASSHREVVLENPSLEHQHLWAQDCHSDGAIEVKMDLMLQVAWKSFVSLKAEAQFWRGHVFTRHSAKKID